MDENNNTIYLNGTINECVSSKLDGIRATLLNLPYASLGYIPWVMNYFNSPTGPQPHPADPLGIFIWLITWLIPILHVIIFMIVNMLASDSTGFILNFAKAIFMRLLTALGDLLWLIIRAAILIFAYLVFAIVLLITAIGYGVLSLFLTLLNLIAQGQLQLSINFLKIQKGNNFISLEYIIDLEYIEFFDIMIPTIHYCYKVNDSLHDTSYNLFKSDDATPSVDFCNTLQEIGNNPIGFDDSEDLEEFLNGIGYAMIIFGSIVSITGSILTIGKSSPYKTLIAYFTLAAASVSLILSTIFFIGYIVNIGGFTENFIQGFAVGNFINMIMGAFLTLGITSVVLEIVIHLFEIGLSIWGITEDVKSLIKRDISNIFEFPELIVAIAIYGLAYISFEFVDSDSRLPAGLLFTVIAGGIGTLLWILLFP